MVDRRNASEWGQPAFHVDGLPVRPVPIRSNDNVWKYVDVRRLPAYVERSIEHGLQWVVFEPNDEPTWATAREQVAEFLTTLWRGSRLVGTKPEDAFFVRVDRTTMTQSDIDNGRLIVVIGLATLRPAEFVIVQIGLWTAVSDDDDD